MGATVGGEDVVAGVEEGALHAGHVFSVGADAVEQDYAAVLGYFFVCWGEVGYEFDAVVGGAGDLVLIVAGAGMVRRAVEGELREADAGEEDREGEEKQGSDDPETPAHVLMVAICQGNERSDCHFGHQGSSIGSGSN